MKNNNPETLLKSLKPNNTETGEKIIGCFPLYPPLELFHSMGLTPVVLWGLQNIVQDTTECDRHLQNYACSVSRYLTQFILDKGLPFFDGLFFYNACDTLRNLPEIITEGLREKNKTVKMHSMHIPVKSLRQDYAVNHLRLQIEKLIAGLEKYDAFSPDKFRNSVHLYNRIREVSESLEKHVSSGKLSYGIFSEVLCQNYFRTAEEQLSQLENLAGRTGTSTGNSYPGVLVSGILPPPSPVIKLIEDLNLRIAGNDVASQRRSYSYRPRSSGDPAEYYADFYSNHFPCTTLHHTAHRRIGNLLQYINKTEAKGVILAGEKFCEYEFFEYPFLQKRLKEEGIPSLLLEFSMDDSGDSGTFMTRVEAFAELLHR